MPAELFATQLLSVRYGGVLANDRVSLRVGRGEIVGLIGPNGAGKTSFVDAVTGFARSSGAISLDGQPVDGLAPHRRRAAGLARTWQGGELFADLTVAQNLAVATQQPGWRTLARDVFTRQSGPSRDVTGALEMLGLSGVADRRPPELALGQQKLAGVARALVGGTTMLLLDEPAAGLDTHESVEFGAELSRIAATGMGVLLIDHDMTLVLDVCDRIYVLDFGRVIADGPADAIRNDPAVVAAYLGTAVAE